MTEERLSDNLELRVEALEAEVRRLSTLVEKVIAYDAPITGFFGLLEEQKDWAKLSPGARDGMADVETS